MPAIRRLAEALTLTGGLRYSLTPVFKKAIIVLLIFAAGCGLGNEAEQREMSFLGDRAMYNAKVEDSQRMLRKQGFNPGPVDGKIGWRTRQAVKDFQKANNLPVSGYIDEVVFSKLAGQVQAPADSKTQVALRSGGVSQQAGASNEKEKQTILEQSQACLNSLECVKKIQAALKASGFSPGAIDGKIGSKTRKAMSDFQKARGLTASGEIDLKTWQALGEYFP